MERYTEDERGKDKETQNRIRGSTTILQGIKYIKGVRVSIEEGPTFSRRQVRPRYRGVQEGNSRGRVPRGRTERSQRSEARKCFVQTRGLGRPSSDFCKRGRSQRY